MYENDPFLSMLERTEVKAADRTDVYDVIIRSVNYLDYTPPKLRVVFYDKNTANDAYVDLFYFKKDSTLPNHLVSKLVLKILRTHPEVAERAKEIANSVKNTAIPPTLLALREFSLNLPATIELEVTRNEVNNRVYFNHYVKNISYE